jgi:hypothetical protein
MSTGGEVGRWTPPRPVGRRCGSQIHLALRFMMLLLVRRVLLVGT